MKDSISIPTYTETLERFGLKVKPIRQYHEGFSLSFNIENGKMFCLVIITTKAEKLKIDNFEVKSKDHLNKLLAVKSFHEIPLLTEVVN